MSSENEDVFMLYVHRTSFLMILYVEFMFIYSIHTRYAFFMASFLPMLLLSHRLPTIFIIGTNIRG